MFSKKYSRWGITAEKSGHLSIFKMLCTELTWNKQMNKVLEFILFNIYYLRSIYCKLSESWPTAAFVIWCTTKVYLFR